MVRIVRSTALRNGQTAKKAHLTGQALRDFGTIYALDFDRLRIQPLSSYTRFPLTNCSWLFSIIPVYIDYCAHGLNSHEVRLASCSRTYPLPLTGHNAGLRQGLTLVDRTPA